MKKFIKIFLSSVLLIIIASLFAINIPTVQDKLLNIGLKNLTVNATPFLDEEDNKNISNKNKIKDVTKKSLGTVYQFTGFRKEEEE